MTPKTKLQGARSGLRGGIATFGCICQLHGQSSAVEDSRQDILLLKKMGCKPFCYICRKHIGFGSIYLMFNNCSRGYGSPKLTHYAFWLYHYYGRLIHYHKWVSSKTHLLPADLENYHKIENVFILSPSVRLCNNCRSYGNIFKGFLITLYTDDFLGLKTDSQTNSTWSKFTAGLPVLFLLLKKPVVLNFLCHS